MPTTIKWKDASVMYVVNAILNVFVAKAILEGGKWTMAMCHVCEVIVLLNLFFSVKTVAR